MSSNKKSKAEAYKILAIPTALLFFMGLLTNDEIGVTFFYGIISLLLFIAYLVNK
jgi:hypothetical protein